MCLLRNKFSTGLSSSPIVWNNTTFSLGILFRIVWHACFLVTLCWVTLFPGSLSSCLSKVYSPSMVCLYHLFWLPLGWEISHKKMSWQFWKYPYMVHRASTLALHPLRLKKRDKSLKKKIWNKDNEKINASKFVPLLAAKKTSWNLYYWFSYNQQQ